jgi:hypothetical protein
MQGMKAKHGMVSSKTRTTCIARSREGDSATWQYITLRTRNRLRASSARLQAGVRRPRLTLTANFEL